MNTDVTINPRNGHHVSKTGDTYTLNGKEVRASDLPDWYLSGDFPVTYTFGPLIEWGGGLCPVPFDTVVRCLFRNRNPYIGPATPQILVDAGMDINWLHAGGHKMRFDPGRDIVAYQVEVL